MTILTKASSLATAAGGALRHHGIKAACYKSTSTHVPFPAGIIDTLQISRHIYEQEGFVPEEVTDSYAVSPAEAALRTTAPHTSAASAGGGLNHYHGLLWSHWHPGPTAGVEYQTRQFAGSLRKNAAVYDPSIWDWGDFSHIQPDHPVAARPIMPGDEDYDPVTINDMPTHSEANVKADRSDIDPLLGHGPLWSHRHNHGSMAGYQTRQFSSLASYVIFKRHAPVQDPSVWDWGFFSHIQPDHQIPPRPILPGDPHYDPVTINDMPSESEAIVKAERANIDLLPMGLHKVIPLPVGEAMPEATESEMDVKADRSPMAEDPLHSGYGYVEASYFSGGEMGEGMKKEIYIREERVFMEDFGEEDESIGTSFGEGEGTEGYEGQMGYFGEEGPALRRRYGLEEVVGMEKSAEEMELEDAMLPHFYRFY
ncbi:hypothetical protein B0H65DRAFT_67444 [Neurospora tetraspora]|uniref:Uncharacterized protein n=1 Tax=Neurospora tetraspora TaxID=94610 RepID=A0AAE0JRE8_9PEZI|nr:hypothetical protein B0H65DRAFT_67444 [Neurospora tetraspora]